MANRLDRLERLFSARRKTLPAPSESSDPVVVDLEQTFPAPSFIRPTASRMTARDEVAVRYNGSRTSSVPAPLILPRRTSVSNRGSSSTGSITHTELPSIRCSELFAHELDSLIAGLAEFEFTQPLSSTDSENRLSAISSGSLPSINQRPLSPRSPAGPLVVVPGRIDTPPSSEPEDEDEAKLLMSKHPLLSSIAAPPTPGASPDLQPVSDRRFRDSKLSDIFNDELPRPDSIHFSEAPNLPGLFTGNADLSQPSSPHESICSSILREPDFNEFLNLSDDDIAEAALETEAPEPPQDVPLPLPSMDASVSSQLRLSSLMTLTPPRASQPAMAAAFEAARIANRYDFDLVYVVNLWPGKITPTTSTSALDCHGAKTGNTQRPLIGRLLAAHGLHHVPSPLQISSAVHSTILRSDGWIEYRNETAVADDLARGYACSFYSGQYGRGNSVDSNAPVSGVRLSERIDRGIVFAAYRKPRAGDNRLGSDLKQDDLGSLHADVEALVEMLIDIHVANRLRQPTTRKRLSDDIGPMPSGQVQFV